MGFRPAHEADAAAWQALLEGSTAGDFLHDWAWAPVAARDGQPQRRFVLEEDGRLTALAAAQVRRLAMGRSFWYVPHGPVIDYRAASAADRFGAVVEGLREAARADRAIAVRIEPRIATGDPALAVIEAARLRHVAGHLQPAHTRIVPLGTDEEMLAALDKDTRYSVRRAEREGVVVTLVDDPADVTAIDALYELTRVTQQRAGFALRPRERFVLSWQSLAGAGRAWILEARHDDELLASAMLLLEGGTSFYFLAGSRREEAGQPKRFASHALQWAMMRKARDLGAREHDMWGVAPPGSGPSDPMAGVTLFKKGFGGRELSWAGMWDVVVDPLGYRLREAAHPLLELVRRARRR